MPSIATRTERLRCSSVWKSLHVRFGQDRCQRIFPPFRRTPRRRDAYFVDAVGVGNRRVLIEKVSLTIRSAAVAGPQ